MASPALLLVVVSALAGVAKAFPSGEPFFDATRHFAVQANSTCADPPTMFELQFAGAGSFANCSPGQFEASLMVDRNLETRWQSTLGESPVAVTFTLQQPSLSLELTGLRMTVPAQPPRTTVIEVMGVEMGEWEVVRVYVAEGESCTPYDVDGVPCSGFEPLDEGEVVICAFSSPMAISQFRIIGTGFDPALSELQQYFTIAEVSIFAWVADGHYVRSTNDIRVEGESGLIVDAPIQPLTVVQGNSDEEFPGFSGRGYAQLQYSSTERVRAQWLLSSLPVTSNYQLWLHYINRGSPRPLSVTVMQEGQLSSMQFRFILEAGCESPCYARAMFATLNGNIVEETTAIFNFTEAPITIIISLTSLDILVDSFIAIPEEFYSPSSLEEQEQFTDECDIVTGTLGQGTPSEAFCLSSAVQLSAEFYQSTFDCNCDPPVSCSEYGGQCPCQQASDGLTTPTGRQCNICPFYFFLSVNGCAACGCPDSTDDCGLNGGQCSCPPLVEGRTCSMCQENSFGDPFSSSGCEICTCDATGSELCDNSTGMCFCKPGVTGMNCDICEEGAFNFTALGCEECGCDSVGSEGVGCDADGQCQCKPGVGGPKCSQCLSGFFFLDSTGCTMCNCSNRTTDCQADPSSSSSSPLETCVCPPPYTGSSCEICLDGFFLSSSSGNCEACECNGRATLCLPGSGTCLNCTDDSAGESCEVCADGFYDADPGLGLLCQPCPCTGVTALSDSCSADSSGAPVCSCRPGHEGALCNRCAEGYFGMPPDFRCTQCDCNGNINTSIPGSCNTTTGECVLCINNATGPECEFCLPGYYGNASEQNCQSCSCSSDGATSSFCDRSTGQCLCLPGVNGLTCTECLPGHWNFQPGLGCEECVCGEGALNDECNRTTGACPCQPGVGGTDCSVCLDGFFNFTAGGCTACECGIGTVNSSCSVDGYCYCQLGVVGEKCNICDRFHSNLSSAGCEPCGECEQNLISQLSGSEEAIEQAVVNAELLEALQEADMSGLTMVEQQRRELERKVSAVTSFLAVSEDQVDTLTERAADVQQSANIVENQVDRVQARILELQPIAEEVQTHAQDVYNNQQDILIATDFSELSAFISNTVSLLYSQEALANTTAANVMAIVAPQNCNYSTVLAEASEVNQSTCATRELAEVLLNSAMAYNTTAQNLLETLRSFMSTATLLEATVNTSAQWLAEVRAAAQGAEVEVMELLAAVEAIQEVADRVELVTDNAENQLMSAQGLLFLASDDIITVRLLLGEEPEEMSGSGMGSALLPLSPLTNPTLMDMASLFQSSLERVGVSVGGSSATVQMAQEHAASLNATATQLLSILEAALSSNPAVGVIVDYSDALAIIRLASNLTATANSTLQQVQADLEALDVVSLEQEVYALVVAAGNFAERSLQINTSAEAILMALPGAEVQAASATSLALSAQEIVDALARNVTALRGAASLSLSTGATLLGEAEEQLEIMESSYDLALALTTSLHSNVSQSEQQLNNAQEALGMASIAISTANATALGAQETLQDQVILTEALTQETISGAQQLEDIRNTVGRIQEKLTSARQAAASIDVALQFFGNSSVGYQIPTDIRSNVTHISLAFQPSSFSGVVLGGDGLTLELSNGSVQFDAGLRGILSTPAGSLQQDQWYHLLASSEELSGQLSVAPLQGGTTFTSSLSTSTPPNPTPDIIYLGGFPMEEEARGFEGCLDRAIVNGAQLSLLTPDEGGEQGLLTCGPRPPAEPVRAMESGAWLQGAGSFIQLSSFPLTPSFQVQFSFRTYSEEAVLFSTYGGSQLMQHVSLVLSGGRVVLEVSVTAMDSTAPVASSGDYSDGQWYTVALQVAEGNVSALINMTEELTAVADLAGSFGQWSQLYMGGLPEDMAALQFPSLASTLPSFAGCLRDVVLDGESVVLGTSSNHSQVVFTGCPAEVSPGVRFMGLGGASFSALDGLTSVSFAFRSTQLAAPLLQVGSEFSVSLFHSQVRVAIPLTSNCLTLTSSQTQLNDNRWHNVEVIISNDSVTLTTDNVPVNISLSSTALSGTFIVGGGASPVAEGFRGCLAGLTIDGNPVDFNAAMSLDGVSLYGCQPPSSPIPIPPPPPPLPPPPSIRPNVSVGLSGTTGSFLAYELLEEQVADGYNITLEFQTVSTNALLLLAQSSPSTHQFQDFLALELHSGQLVYSYNLGGGRAENRTVAAYDDGYVHVVELRRSGIYGELIVDGGVETLSLSSPTTHTQLNANSGWLFVGGIPSSLSTSDTSLLFPREPRPHSALACFHALNINGRYIDVSLPNASSGAEPCLESYSNTVSLNSTGYLQMMDRYTGGVSLSVSLEFRTTQCSGLLVYSSSHINGDYILLEISDGIIRFVFDNGQGKVPVIFSPANSSQFCDGNWHSVKVEKDGIAGSLVIDGTNIVNQRSPFSGFFSVNTNDPLYVGGVPAEERLRYTVMADSFTGCLANFQLSGEDGQVESLLFSQAPFSTGAVFNACIFY